MANLPISGCGHETSSPAAQRYGAVGADAAVDDRLGVLGVVDLVEHRVRRRAELPQAQGRGDEQDERHRQGVAVAAGGVLDTEWACEHQRPDLFKYAADAPTV